MEQNMKTEGKNTDFFMKDKIALVTGAARGIGLATDRAFAQAGAIAVFPISTSRPNRWKKS